MIQPMPKQDYLADLQARNRRNREVVETTFVPLNEAQRSWRPPPNEWSVDQCFQHLVKAFEWLSPNFVPALDKPQRLQSDGIFRHGWLASRTMEKQFDPQTKGKTVLANDPTAVYKADILTQWLARQAQLETIIERAAAADLQAKCHILKWLPIRYNLGDYLLFFVAHDELHIDQAQRALAACRENTAVQLNKVLAKSDVNYMKQLGFAFTSPLPHIPFWGKPAKTDLIRSGKSGNSGELLTQDQQHLMLPCQF